MTPEDFISALRKQTCNGAAEAVNAALIAPPGKQPSEGDLQLSEWFHRQSSADQARVREIVAEAVQQATFDFLAILDGVAPVTDGDVNLRLELFSVSGDKRLLLNDPGSEELHRLFSHSGCRVNNRVAPTLAAYEVGEFSELKQRQKVADLLHLHRVPIKFAASTTISGYDAATAPCIALPPGEHRRVEKK